MANDRRISRRGVVSGLAATGGTLLLAGCDRLSQAPWARDVLSVAENLTQSVQRLFLDDNSLAREFTEADISPDFRANGTTQPSSPVYRQLAAGGFADWRLEVDGLVEQPLSLTLDELRAMPARTQITRHDCVEGWSSIGKWTGPQLSAVLEKARLRPEARFVMFHCLDTLGRAFGGSNQYYESIDLVDALHAQTILAHTMNGEPLPIRHGAPVRVRVERQLGYKMAKYLQRIEVIADFTGFRGGRGGYWEDRGYDWYAGI